MAGLGDSSRRYSVGLALVISAAVVGVSYAIGRADQQWSKEHRPFAGLRARRDLRRDLREARRESILDLIALRRS